MREQGKSSLGLISLLRKLTRTEGKTILNTGEIDAINTKCGKKTSVGKRKTFILKWWNPNCKRLNTIHTMNFYFLDEVVSNILENYTNRSFVTGSMHDISTILIMWMCTYLHKKVQQIWLSHRGNCCKNLISYEIIFPQNKSVLNTRVYNKRRKSLGYPVPATVSAGR